MTVSDLIAYLAKMPRDAGVLFCVRPGNYDVPEAYVPIMPAGMLGNNLILEHGPEILPPNPDNLPGLRDDGIA